ncbi:hypothetical protein ACHAPU_002385 [Fusarium lateritium]
MALQKFHLFTQLPREIRTMIYILATPPRVVHIQERTEDRDDFIASWKTRRGDVKLDPALIRFAPNWTKRAAHNNFKPGMSASDMLFSYIHRRPETAWHLVRKGYFYSNAPIPPFLHTCRESRAELKTAGYEITFRTRSTGPRTWFNHARDSLYLQEYNPLWVAGEVDIYNILTSNCNWDYGQLDPCDMQKVRKLALATARYYSDTWLIGQTMRRRSQERMMRMMVGMFGGLEEVLFFDWKRGHEDIKGEDLSDWVVDNSLHHPTYVYGEGERPWVPEDFGLNGKLGWIRHKRPKNGVTP